MKRHKMTVDVQLTMPDNISVKDARRAVVAALEELSQVGVIGVGRVTGARAWQPRERDFPAIGEITE